MILLILQSVFVLDEKDVGFSLQSILLKLLVSNFVRPQPKFRWNEDEMKVAS